MSGANCGYLLVYESRLPLTEHRQGLDSTGSIPFPGTNAE